MEEIKIDIFSYLLQPSKLATYNMIIYTNLQLDTSQIEQDIDRANLENFLFVI